MSRLHFPDGFHWGAASAAYATEGAWAEDGKGESIWDRFCHTRGRIRDGGNGDVASDAYHRVPEDVALLGDLHLTSYHFSIAWARILPDGGGSVNAKGLDHYRRLVDRLLEAGVRPLPTLYHWDLPRALQDRGGWADRDTAGRFADYAETTARALGDRVGDWLLLHDPATFTARGYRDGTHAPGLQERHAYLRATHVVNLAQAEGLRAVRASVAKARIGSSVRIAPCEPRGDTPADAAACARFDAFTNAWFLDPPLRGRYPEAFVAGPPLDRMGVQEGDLERVHAPLDFIGIGIGARMRIEADDLEPLGIRARAFPAEPDAVPGAVLHDAVMQTMRRYDDPLLEITSDGCDTPDDPDPARLRDDAARTLHLRGALEGLARALEQGARVRSYHVWSLLDGFAWSDGYGARTGLAHVDFDSADRKLKASGLWYATVAAEHGFES